MNLPELYVRLADDLLLLSFLFDLLKRLIFKSVLLPFFFWGGLLPTERWGREWEKGLSLEAQVHE